MRITFASPVYTRAGALCVFVTEDRVLAPAAERLDRATGGAVRRAIAASRFKGGREQVLQIVAPAGLKASRIVLVGLGKAEALDALGAEAAGGTIVAALAGAGDRAAAVVVDAVRGAPLKTAEIAAHVGLGALLRSYRFDKYRTREKAEDKPALATLTVMTRDAAAARKIFAPLAHVAAGVFFTRDLVSEPANEIGRAHD